VVNGLVAPPVQYKLVRMVRCPPMLDPEFPPARAVRTSILHTLLVTPNTAPMSGGRPGNSSNSEPKTKQTVGPEDRWVAN